MIIKRIHARSQHLQSGALAAAILLFFFAFSPLSGAEPASTATLEPVRASATVGMVAEIREVVLPGPELEALPQEDRKAPVVVRILEAYPHGDAFRYDLSFYGLEPGRLDLTPYLRRKDGSSTANLPPLWVEVRSVLPPGQIVPQPLPVNHLPALGGYRLAVSLALIAWLGGLLFILFWGRKWRAKHHTQRDRPVTLAERLRPLVEQARAGTLSVEERAELERTLITYWRQRLNLKHLSSAELYSFLRNHPEAGPLFEHLEAWLHRRPGTAPEVDVAALLEPYQTLLSETSRAPAEVAK